MSEKQTNGDIADEIAILSRWSAKPEGLPSEALGGELLELLQQVDPGVAEKVRSPAPEKGMTPRSGRRSVEAPRRWLWWTLGALAIGTVSVALMLRPAGFKPGGARLQPPSEDLGPSFEPVSPVPAFAASSNEPAIVVPTLGRDEASSAPSTVPPLTPEAAEEPLATPQSLPASVPAFSDLRKPVGADWRSKPVQALVRRHDRAPESAHVVQRGESLSLIALRHLGRYQRWPEIYNLNRETIRDPNMIRVGQRLLLPGKRWRVKPSFYRSQPGDTLKRIAERHLGSASAWARIYALNRSVVPDPLLLRPGTLLQLPTVRLRRADEPVTSRPARESFMRYRVRAGDSLGLLARRYLGSASRWQEIHRVNRQRISHPNWIYPGQVLLIPQQFEPARMRYVVRSGDSLWVIAIKSGGVGQDWRAWYDANRDSVMDPHWIWPGQPLRIPAF
jgi:nucleoid-associated protein YgaU